MKANNTTKKYEAPAIVYEGRISTRAGSTRDATNSGGVDLFNGDE